jgi:hypothetical protein
MADVVIDVKTELKELVHRHLKEKYGSDFPIDERKPLQFTIEHDVKKKTAGIKECKVPLLEEVKKPSLN